MGYLPQESSIFRGLTVEQNIRAVLETLEDHDDERDAALEDLMAEFGITHLATRHQSACPAVNVAVWKLPALLLRARHFFCLMNLWPVLTQLPSAKFVI